MTIQTDYTDTMSRLADRVATQVAAAYDSWQAGGITEEQFRAVVEAYLAAADNRATALADVALAMTLTAQRRQAVAPLGLTPPPLDHGPRIGELVAAGAVVEKWRSYGRGSTLARAQDAYADAMVERGVPAWTRVLNAGACELCQDLAGEVLPGSARMYHHDGCGCTQRPITEERETA